MSRDFTRKFGWAIRIEPAPSLNRHYVPNDGHKLTHDCWCCPTLQGEPTLSPPYTMVIHNDTPRA